MFSGVAALQQIKHKETPLMEKVYTKSIRNVALLGHSGGGKTSLAESMLYISRLTDRLGNIADGNTRMVATENATPIPMEAVRVTAIIPSMTDFVKMIL